MIKRMVMISRRVLSVLLLAGVLFSAVTGCIGEQSQQTGANETNPFTSFRDIPGLTDKEIADIEALQRTRDSFSYGMISSIEAFTKDNGELGGYSVLFTEWLTGLFDIPFLIEIYPMNVVLERLDALELDFSGVVMTNDFHLNKYMMTDIIAERQFVTMRAADSPRLGDLTHTIRYAFITGTPSEPSVAAVTAPGSYVPVYVDNAMGGYHAVINGEADAFIMSKNNDALFASNADVIIEDFFPLIFNPVSMATANPEFESVISVIKKAQQNGADSYLNHVYSLAYQDYQMHKIAARLTDRERAYLAGAGKIPVVARSTNYPMSFYSERSGEWQGIFFDILDEITRLTGLEFEVAHDKNTSWEDMNELLINNKAAFAPRIDRIRDHEEHFMWSDVLLYRDDFALISRADHRNLVLNNITSEKIGLASDTICANTFNKWFPNHRNIIWYDSLDLAFEALIANEVDNVMATRYRLMQLTHYQELPGYKANFIFDQSLENRFAFSKDETELMSIIDKALVLINTESIVNQWTSRTYDYRIKTAEERIPLLVGVIILSVFFVALALAMFIWSRNAARKEAKANLLYERQLAKMDLMVKAANIGLWDVEVDVTDTLNPMNAFIWSDEFRAMLGYESEEEFPNVLASFKDAMHPDYHEKSDKAFIDHVFDKTGKTPFDLEYQLRKKNGEYAYFHACGEAIRDSEGNALHIAGALMDITEAKNEQQRVMLMLDTSPLSIAIWDKNLNIVDCNKSTISLLGLKSKQDYKNRFYIDCQPEYQSDGLLSADKATVLLNEAFEIGQCTFEWTLRKPDDGTLIPVEVTLVRAKFGDEDMVVGYTRDLREYKEQQALVERLRDADQRMRTLLEANPQINFLFDENFKIIDCNQSAIDFLGFGSKDEMLAGFVNRLTSSIPEFQPDGRVSIPLTERLEKAVETGQVKFETELHLNGEKRILDVEFKRIPHKNSIAVVGFVHELTEMKNLINEAERQRIEAETANKTKSEFLSHISHEIRTPMNAVLGTAEIQLQKDNIQPEMEEAFNMIFNSGNLLLNIIDDILDLSKIEAGKLVVIPEKYDIPSIVYDTIQVNLLRYDSKPIDFLLKIDENTPLEMIGDELRIKQIMNNILSNAFKYTDKGTVELSVNAEDIVEGGAGDAGDDQPDVMLVIRIRDTGQGMTEEQINMLFDEYTRFNIDTNRTIVGTGLGMHITKRLLDAMDGDVTVESCIDEGTLFTVRIPQIKAGESVCGSEMADQLRSNRFKGVLKASRAQIIREYMPYGSVLVVDDVESNLYVAKGMMLPYGLKIETVLSGFEAINKIKEGTVYDIVFMDHMMPVMNGIDTMKALREIEYNFPIIALTANAVVGTAAMFLENGFDGFMSKPIDMRELNSVLNRFIRDKQTPETIEEAKRQMEKRKTMKKSDQNAQMQSYFAKIVVKDIEKALVILEYLLPEMQDSSTADLNLYTTTVHGLKSALMNIGETELSADALMLEQAGGSGNITDIELETPVFIAALRTMLVKYKPEKTGGAEGTGEAGDESDNNAFLTEKLSEIKAACELIQKRTAKAAIEELRARTWPNEINELLDEISICLLNGEFKKITSIILTYIG